LSITAITTLLLAHKKQYLKGIWATAYGSTVGLNSISLYPGTASPTPAGAATPILSPTSSISSTTTHSPTTTEMKAPESIVTSSPTISSTLYVVEKESSFNVIEDE
jgi:hypothetical protein